MLPNTKNMFMLKVFKYLAPLLSPRAFFSTLFFNFYYLSFRQAVQLPIWVYKLHVKDMGGQILIDSKTIRPGMIRLGFFGARLYPNTGIQWSNRGKIIFKGSCHIRHNSSIVVGEQSTVIFGDDFLATTSLKLVSFIGITFGKRTRVGWDCLFMDTNFHPLFDMEKQKYTKAYGKIEIGDYNWFPTQCVVMPGTKTPERCIFSLRSVIGRRDNKTFEPYCIHAGDPLRIVKRNIRWDYQRDFVPCYSD